MSLATERDLSPEPREQAASPHDWIGSVIQGRYRVSGWLGSGGMGDVFEVLHTGLGKRFALKALRPELAHDVAMVERFRREVQAMAGLTSEHVVSILDSGVMPNGAPYFVMERLLGQDLRRLLQAEGPLPPARVSQLGVDACRGLSAVHAAGLVHRDLKPENLFIAIGDDGREICKILDFGVAKSPRDNSTRPGALVGTTRYMAPEQVGLEHALGPHTDVYALGVILYECLAGKVPFDGDTVERVLFKIMTEPERPLIEWCPDVPPGLTETVHAALRKQPRERPGSALALAAALLPYTAPYRPRVVTVEGLLDVVQPSPERTSTSDATVRDVKLESSANPSSEVASRQRPKTRLAPSHVVLGVAVLSGATTSLLTWMATRAVSSPSPSSGASANVAVPHREPDPLPPSSAGFRLATPSAERPPARSSASTVDAAPVPAPARTGPVPSRAARTHLRTSQSGDALESRAENGTPPRSVVDSAPPPAAFDPKNPYGR